MNYRLFLLLCFIPLTLVVSSQSVNPGEVNVSELSDQQINRIVEEINKRGLGEDEAMALGRAKGLSQEQISQLRRRINELKNKGTNNINNSVLVGDGSDNIIVSVKKAIDSTKVDNRIFGFNLFNNDNLTFDPSINIPVPKSYVLGPGDELIIDIWGASQASYKLEVDKNGNVSVPLVGPIHLGGSSLEIGERMIKNRLASIYSDITSTNPRTFVSIQTGQLKTIRINVIGEAINPGSYIVPGTASLFNVMYLCGGPNKQGSFRDIQLIRGGKVLEHFDIYDFLINGNYDVNFPLLDNDVIKVSSYIKRVRIYGKFKRIGVFEAIDGETIGDMVKYASGFSEAANKSRIELYRYGKFEREFKSVPIDSIQKIIINNGDSLYVGKILNRYSNKININGAVFNPGNYEYIKGLTLSELIKKAGGLQENAYLNRGVITRLKKDYTPEKISFALEPIINMEDDIELFPNDEIFISSIDEMREERTVAIWGEVQKMGKYKYAENITLGDLVLIAGGFKESASGSSIEVMRRLPYAIADTSSGANSQLFSFEISRELKLDDAGSQFRLNPFDEVFVRFMPGFRDNSNVLIGGQVMYSGIYGLSSRKERVSDMVRRAGGITPNAYPKGAKLTRKYDLSREEKAMRKELMEKDSTIYFSDLNFETISIDLEKILQEPGCKEDIFMEHGDELEIPAMLQTIKVSGEVLNPTSTVFVKGWGARQYVNNSGGFAINAKRGKTYVLYPNGSAAATRGFLFFRNFPKVTPGSEIIIPKKPEREGLSAQAWIGITSALASLSLTVVTIVNNTK